MAFAGNEARDHRDADGAPVKALRPAKGRILIIVENLPVPFDRRVWTEARTLRAAGYEVSIICPRGPFAESKYECLEDIHIYRHPLPFEASSKLGYIVEYGSAIFWEFAYSLRVWRQRGFDVIQACNPPDFIFLIGAFYKYLLGKKFLFDHHDLNPELFEAKFNKRGAVWKILRLLERLTFRVADLSIATNNSYRRVAIERGGMSPDKVYVVRSGPDLDRVRPSSPDDAWRNGRKHLAAYVGVIGEQEGIDLLIEAMEHIVRQRQRKDVQVVVMGSGPKFATVRALAESKGLSPYMTFPGRVDDATLFTVLSTADICVNPDRPNAMNDQSTMNKTMEYMAMGKAMVQFDLTESKFSAQGSSLYARNTDAADFGDKMLELLDDPSRRRAMGELGRQRVYEELSWPHEAPKLLACYERLFAKEGR